MPAVKPIPDGYHSVTPYLIFSGAGEAIAFYKRALGAEEVMRMDSPGGKVGHAEIKIGDSRIMLADEHPEIGALSPKTIGGSPVSIHLYVENVDAAVERAVAAGAKLIQPVEDKFYGDRTGGIEDPFGYRWYIATHKEDLTTDEISEGSHSGGEGRLRRIPEPLRSGDRPLSALCRQGSIAMFRHLAAGAASNGESGGPCQMSGASPASN